MLHGAGTVVDAGRDRNRLDTLLQLGADAVVQLSDDADSTEPAERTMMALLSNRADRGRPLDWIEIGAVAGPTLKLPSVALRSANLRLQGSGRVAVSPAGYLAELPTLIAEIDAGAIAVQTTTVPLADIEALWARPNMPGIRTVLTT